MHTRLLFWTVVVCFGLKLTVVDLRGATLDARQLRDQAERCRQLLNEGLIDFYLPDSLDRVNGGFLESLRNGQFAPTGEKFLTFQARQVWFFSTAAAEGFQRDRTLRAARHGFEFLTRTMRDPAYGGYFSKVTDAGGERDPRKHVYLNAFVLYSFAAYYRASRDPVALERARELFEVLEDKAYDREHGGYIEFFQRDWQPITDPAVSGYVGAAGHKTFNTHLHVLEAFTELYRVWPDERVRQRLMELIQINTSTVLHFEFNQNVDAHYRDWRRVEEPRNLRGSYGHDVECAWLTLDAARALGLAPDLFRGWADALCRRSIELGYDRQQGGFFLGGPLGRPADDTKKVWWVQAEALVALLEMFQLTGRREYYDLFTQTFQFVEQHQAAKEGSWWATRAADGSPTEDRQRTGPWHAGYHAGRALILCAQMLDRLAERAAGDRNPRNP